MLTDPPADPRSLLPADHIILKVNAAGERMIFFLGALEEGYYRVLSGCHYPVQHELSAFPKKYTVDDGRIYLCSCGLRALVPFFIRNKGELLDLFKQYNP